MIVRARQRDMWVRTIGVPRDAIRNAAEGVPLLVGGELEAVVDAIEFVEVGRGIRVDALLLELELVAVGLGEACDDVSVCLKTGHGRVLSDSGGG